MHSEEAEKHLRWTEGEVLHTPNPMGVESRLSSLKEGGLSFRE